MNSVSSGKGTVHCWSLRKVSPAKTNLDTRRTLPEHSIVELGSMVQQGDELYHKVKAPSDGILDSRFLLNMSDMGAELSRTMRVGADAFDMDDFMQRVARFAGGTAVHIRANGRAVDALEAELASGDTESWDWDKLGTVAAQHARRAPVVDCLLGPLQVTPKHRKFARSSRLDTGAEHIAPQQLEADDLAQSENETSHVVMEIARLLDEKSGGDGEGVCLFQFALNPHSFSNSVENLFYVSFLIRDGKAAILHAENGDPRLMSTYEPTEEDWNAGVMRRQIVLELDMETWAALVELYNVTEPTIPTRQDDVQTSNGRTWYA